MSTPIKILLVVLALAIIGYGGYLLLSSGQAGDSSVAVAGGSTLSQEENLTNKQFLDLLRSLKDVHLKDNPLFANSAFVHLTDFSVDLTAEPSGRDNPFAPLTAQAVDQPRGAAAPAAPAAPASTPASSPRSAAPAPDASF